MHRSDTAPNDSLSLNELQLQQQCRSLTGIDISGVAFAKANGQAAASRLENTCFFAMDGKAMAFADGSFDLAFGRGILQHLDLEKSFGGIARVLRGGSLVIFCEPTGHNPILNLYRRATPDVRSVGEPPLLMTDFAMACRRFAVVETHFYRLFSAASRLFDRSSKGLPNRACTAVDDWILRFPAIGRYAWYCLIVCRKR